MKKTGFILVFLLLIFIPALTSAKCELKYNFQYLFNWVASEMKIKINSQKPQPKFKIIPEKELRRLYGEEKLVMEKDGTTIILELNGFYEPSENTIYVKKEFDPSAGPTFEEFIVHELAHYFQNLYRPSDFDKINDPCLKDPYWFWTCPWEREAYEVERKFKVQHNLTITNDDLEHLND